MTVSTLKSLYKSCKESSLFGRYIHNDSINHLIENLASSFHIEVVGYSVKGLPIHSIKIGHGDKRIMMWSQMHGNESTTTKAIFDLCNVFLSNDATALTILNQCTILSIPILNPDGAAAYTRLNANGIDLNRDAQALSQPESQVLRRLFDDFQPNFCFNLHGQRTIYSAGATHNPASISFLAPAQDEKRSITNTRKMAMSLIVKMNEVLQQQITGQVGIYDDSFNLDCVGDTFQSMHVPTVLFEAGHCPNDYNREQIREYIFQSLLVSIACISNKECHPELYQHYLKIPNNEKLFFDIIIRNTSHNDIAIQFEEKLIEDKVEFVPKIEKISDLSNFYGHKEINANGHEVFGESNTVLKVGNEIVFVLINNEKFSLKL